MRLSELKKIIKMVEDSNIDELEIKGIFRRVRVTKRLSTHATAEVVPSSTSTTKVEVAGKEKVKPEKKVLSIKAPMVGTFYRSPSPGATPYVEIGDKINVGKVVCIIEAMKVMNEIESDVAGTLREILVKNEEPVEYGQELFILEPE
ncbi:MAG: acetyl-CoA carboxylase biotin carboxyl carrier protein [bacterium]|nr:acetyl-CoA carboxylase biotin carboxyl carrier protein [bacterium]